MEKQAYLQERLESDKGRMKGRLLEWGGTLDRCGRKQEELRKLGKLREEQRQIWLEQETEGGRQILQEIDRIYEEQLQRIKGEMEEMMRKKAEMDKRLLELTGEEQKFVELRYGKGYGFDYISMKLHMSRATLFRLQEKILRTLAGNETH